MYGCAIDAVSSIPGSGHLPLRFLCSVQKGQPGDGGAPAKIPCAPAGVNYKCISCRLAIPRSGKALGCRPPPPGMRFPHPSYHLWGTLKGVHKDVLRFRYRNGLSSSRKLLQHVRSVYRSGSGRERRPPEDVPNNIRRGIPAATPAPQTIHAQAPSCVHSYG